MSHEPWQIDLDNFVLDLTNHLEDGPLEHVSNLETVVTDALLATGFPGVLKLLHSYKDRIGELEQERERLLIRSMAPAKNNQCSKCNGHEDLLETSTFCTPCFIDAYGKVTKQF